MGISAFRALPAVDRVLALALTLYEDRIDPSHGQRRDLAMDPDLADEWSAFPPSRDYAALAMAQIADQVKDDKNPETYRFLIGLKEGWEDRKAAKLAAREAQSPVDP